MYMAKVGPIYIVLNGRVCDYLVLFFLKALRSNISEIEKTEELIFDERVFD
jgi:hypothetical protein